jgi:hypothetical protein
MLTKAEKFVENVPGDKDHLLKYIRDIVLTFKITQETF